MKTTARILALILVLTTIGCDRVTKHLATATLNGTPGRSYLADTIRLEYAENPGAFLSLGARLPEWARTGILTLGAFIGLAAVAVGAFTRHWKGTSLIGALLFLGGGVSNLLDRIMRGAVVDFMNVGVGTFRTGIFNVADIAIMAGAALWILGARREPNASRNETGSL